MTPPKPQDGGTDEGRQLAQAFIERTTKERRERPNPLTTRPAAPKEDES